MDERELRKFFVDQPGTTIVDIESGDLLVLMTPVPPDYVFSPAPGEEGESRRLKDFEVPYTPTAEEVVRALRGPKGDTGPMGMMGEPGAPARREEPRRAQGALLDDSSTKGSTYNLPDDDVVIYPRAES